jgi:enamine deaminase RidA (YjgF/YER057c/UK114 family)
MPGIERFGSGGPWEAIIGYSRVVKAGPLVEVSGCTAVGPDGELVGVGDVGVQVEMALANVVRALAQAGATVGDVTRTRMYLTDVSTWEAAGRAHGEVFAQARPASTMVEVSSLLDPRMLVEIEATAYLLPT